MNRSHVRQVVYDALVSCFASSEGDSGTQSVKSKSKSTSTTSSPLPTTSILFTPVARILANAESTWLGCIEGNSTEGDIACDPQVLVCALEEKRSHSLRTKQQLRDELEVLEHALQRLEEERIQMLNRKHCLELEVDSAESSVCLYDHMLTHLRREEISFMLDILSDSSSSLQRRLDATYWLARNHRRLDSTQAADAFIAMYRAAVVADLPTLAPLPLAKSLVQYASLSAQKSLGEILQFAECDCPILVSSIRLDSKNGDSSSMESESSSADVTLVVSITLPAVLSLSSEDSAFLENSSESLPSGLQIVLFWLRCLRCLVGILSETTADRQHMVLSVARLLLANPALSMMFWAPSSQLTVECIFDAENPDGKGYRDPGSFLLPASTASPLIDQGAETEESISKEEISALQLHLNFDRSSPSLSIVRERLARVHSHASIASVILTLFQSVNDDCRGEACALVGDMCSSSNSLGRMHRVLWMSLGVVRTCFLSMEKRSSWDTRHPLFLVLASALQEPFSLNVIREEVFPYLRLLADTSASIECPSSLRLICANLLHSLSQITIVQLFLCTASLDALGQDKSSLISEKTADTEQRAAKARQRALESVSAVLDTVIRGVALLCAEISEALECKGSLHTHFDFDHIDDNHHHPDGDVLSDSNQTSKKSTPSVTAHLSFQSVDFSETYDGDPSFPSVRSPLYDLLATASALSSLLWNVSSFRDDSGASIEKTPVRKRCHDAGLTGALSDLLAVAANLHADVVQRQEEAVQVLRDHALLPHENHFGEIASKSFDIPWMCDFSTLLKALLENVSGALWSILADRVVRVEVCEEVGHSTLRSISTLLENDEKLRSSPIFPEFSSHFLLDASTLENLSGCLWNFATVESSRDLLDSSLCLRYLIHYLSLSEVHEETRLNCAGALRAAIAFDSHKKAFAEYQGVEAALLVLSDAVMRRERDVDPSMDGTPFPSGQQQRLDLRVSPLLVERTLSILSIASLDSDVRDTIAQLDGVDIICTYLEPDLVDQNTSIYPVIDRAFSTLRNCTSVEANARSMLAFLGNLIRVLRQTVLGPLSACISQQASPSSVLHQIPFRSLAVVLENCVAILRNCSLLYTEFQDDKKLIDMIVAILCKLSSPGCLSFLLFESAIRDSKDTHSSCRQLLDLSQAFGEISFLGKQNIPVGRDTPFSMSSSLSASSSHNGPNSSSSYIYQMVLHSFAALMSLCPYSGVTRFLLIPSSNDILFDSALTTALALLRVSRDGFDAISSSIVDVYQTEKETQDALSLTCGDYFPPGLLRLREHAAQLISRCVEADHVGSESPSFGDSEFTRWILHRSTGSGILDLVCGLWMPFDMKNFDLFFSLHPEQKESIVSCVLHTLIVVRYVINFTSISKLFVDSLRGQDREELSNHAKHDESRDLEPSLTHYLFSLASLSSDHLERDSLLQRVHKAARLCLSALDMGTFSSA